MHKSIFHSDTLCPILAGMICICCLLSGCRMQARTEMFPSKEGYLITIGEDPTDRDTRWAKYLYEHHKKRANDDEMVAFGVSEMDMWRIIIQIDPTLQRGFKVACKGSDIRLTASDGKQMLWLQYQLIKKISKEDPRIDGSDLPPALINLNDTCGAFAFDYQSIYSPCGLNADHTGVIGLNNFDDSWGIWGHNLRKVLGKDAEKVYATIHGKTDDSQLCFSSEDMYRQIENYIVDNFGEKGNFRFVIAPDDTPYACTCTTCTALGNTEKNATPAVTELILRLSQRFPKHTFFTTSYLTTQQVTDKQLPSNVGVIVSAIDYPLRRTDGKDEQDKKFAEQLDGTPGFVLQPYDEVYVRRSPGYQAQQNVAVEGEILFGGSYAMTSREERLSDLIRKAGGSTKKAYLRGAKLTRVATEGEKKRMGDVIRLMSRQLGEAMMDSLDIHVEDHFTVGIDLEKALANPGSTADIVLREGDVISIPKNNNTVTINGAVMVPNTVSYMEGKNIDYYLDQAGGYSENAKKSKKFIVYMNGQVTKVKGSGKKQIEPGCEIIVPSKAKKRTNIGNILGYATTFSTLGMMVASIANLIKK